MAFIANLLYLKDIFHLDIASYFLMGAKENCKKIEKYYILITMLFKQLLG